MDVAGLAGRGRRLSRRARLAGLGRAVTGPITQPRVRFWSTQLVIPTDAGPVWFKENHPGQAFEAGLLSVLGGLVPARVFPVLAVEAQRGWFLADDQGPILRERLGAHPHPSETTAAWVRVATEWAQCSGSWPRGTTSYGPAGCPS